MNQRLLAASYAAAPPGLLVTLALAALSAPGAQTAAVPEAAHPYTVDPPRRDPGLTTAMDDADTAPVNRYGFDEEGHAAGQRHLLHVQHHLQQRGVRNGTGCPDCRRQVAVH